ncbi:hypothetical protein [Pseudomonas syringae]|uniref:hypothetical protein n=1 Tax=Pseudomonas TaxID=286 RepID=UPI000E31F784|nr:hypothetical protein [Pseudomonas syringae]
MIQAKERPILFSAPMVRAILSGQKTVTRREVKKPAALDCLAAGFEPAFLALPGNGDLCPYGKVGDRLWVRETWSDVNLQGAPGIAYRADGDVRDLMEDASFLDEDGAFDYDDPRSKPYQFACWSEDLLGGKDGRWRPSIHIPRWASRILLEITDVRVERLQEGDGETAFESRYVAEGIHRIHHGDGDYYFHPFKDEPGPGNWSDPFDAWRELWVSINGAESWNANPWVWVVEFKRVTP